MGQAGPRVSGAGTSRSRSRSIEIEIGSRSSVAAADPVLDIVQLHTVAYGSIRLHAADLVLDIVSAARRPIKELGLTQLRQVDREGAKVKRARARVAADRTGSGH